MSLFRKTPHTKEEAKGGTGGPGVTKNGLAPEDEGVRMDSPSPGAAEDTAPKDKGKQKESTFNEGKK